jgi:uncharacterized protein YdaU (DUF1376 family)
MHDQRSEHDRSRLGCSPLPRYIDAGRDLGAEQRSAFVLLLVAMWRSPDGTLPDDDRELSLTALVTQRRWRSHVRPALASLFLVNGGKWAFGPMVDDHARSRAATVSKSTKMVRNRARNHADGPLISTDEPVNLLDMPADQQLPDAASALASPLHQDGPRTAPDQIGTETSRNETKMVKSDQQTRSTKSLRSSDIRPDQQTPAIPLTSALQSALVLATEITAPLKPESPGSATNLVETDQRNTISNPLNCLNTQSYQQTTGTPLQSALVSQPPTNGTKALGYPPRSKDIEPKSNGFRANGSNGFNGSLPLFAETPLDTPHGPERLTRARARLRDSESCIYTESESHNPESDMERPRPSLREVRPPRMAPPIDATADQGDGKPTRTGTRLPKDWAPTPADIQFAIDKGMTQAAIERVAETFRDYWLGAAGQKARKADWAATWRNWVRKDLEDMRRHPPRGSPQLARGQTRIASSTEIQRRAQEILEGDHHDERT